MERMWDEGLRFVSLPLDTRITLRGGNSWPLPKTTGYSRGLMSSAQTTPAGPGFGWSPCPAVGRRTCCQECSSSRVQLFLHWTGASVPTQGSALGRQGFQEDSLINPAVEAALVLVHQAHQHFRLLSGVRWQLMGPLSCSTVNGWVAAPSQEASALAFPAPSVMDRHEHWKCYMLVSDPAALLVHVDVPYSIWGVLNTTKLAYQLHMYWTDPLTTKPLELLLEVMEIFLEWSEQTTQGRCGSPL